MEYLTLLVLRSIFGGIYRLRETAYNFITMKTHIIKSNFKKKNQNAVVRWTQTYCAQTSPAVELVRGLPNVSGLGENALYYGGL